jgi:hypothetical protein
MKTTGVSAAQARSNPPAGTQGLDEITGGGVCRRGAAHARLWQHQGAARRCFALEVLVRGATPRQAPWKGAL